MRLKFEAANESWNEYRLEDGTLVRVRVIMVRAVRREGQFNEQGSPMYDLEMQQIVHVDAPPEICRSVYAGTETKQ